MIVKTKSGFSFIKKINNKDVCYYCNKEIDNHHLCFTLSFEYLLHQMRNGVLDKNIKLKPDCL
jgi:hypothetical protein